MPFGVQSADVPEELLAGVPVAEQAERLAMAKERAVALSRARPGAQPVEMASSAVVVAADTIVALDGVPLGKPVDVADAWRMLRSLRGRPHEVITGVVAARGAGGQSGHARTTVHMRPYTDAEIDAYVATGDPFDKAGAYAIQHAGFAPVERIEGCYCNVMGLPLWTVRRLLAAVWPPLITRPPGETFARCAACPLRPGVTPPA